MSIRSYNVMTTRGARPEIRFRSGALRRIVSVLLGCAILGFSVENLIADVHDGDAETQEQASVSIATSADASDSDNPTQPKDSDRSGHSAHVCHCIHAHGGLPGLTDSQVADTQHATQLRGVSDRMPQSISTEPRIRPPLA